ncbi:hypothetical protein RE6C_01241 [Rhodopirellula europaea 6C]|uniref:Uncharacterized protein n=1 Tax=Rhodopirellula europaea 6C TaxID=1263867 RepID=M2AZB9_9BACT|nr:hypothetical protein RE6C_01241 [Rhodopirellula europaea 6C]
MLPLQYNYPSHDLDDLELAQALDRFEARGWITGEDFINRKAKPDRSIKITLDGADVWESERHPDWSRNVTDTSGRTIPDTERHRIRIYGHSLAICREFFDAACACGYYDHDGGQIVTAEGHDQLVYWRPAQRIYLLSAWVNSWSLRTAWPGFEARRTWWRTPDEIGKLWGLPPAQT